MPTHVKFNRCSQIFAWAAACLFVLGFFYSLVGEWTGPILGVWFVGTQKPRRGFLWMMAFAFLPSLLFDWHNFPLTGPEQALKYLAWTLFVAVLGILPFTFHRLISPCLPGFLSTLPFPLAAVAIPALVHSLYSGAASLIGLSTYFIFWFAAILIWMWNQEFRATGIVFAVGFVVAGVLGLLRYLGFAALPINLLSGVTFSWICLGAALFLSVWALFHPIRHKTWANRPQSVALLQSPFTGNPLHVANERGREVLISNSGERFPVRNEIPAFLRPKT